MALIPQQNAIDVYASKEDRSITITEEKGFFNNQNGELEDAHVTIDVAHVDTIIRALEEARKQILGD
ncbi:hypothetical protein J502_2884 [Acinetobacter sp. 1294596]|uniref:hypothetical protein n=1 Tax=Acinetobacter sp. 1294596 TaxID=1310603 RepID=UPI00044A20F7|nr:hypothetical protein [Acinetobacter sp. 1294596]EXF56015.1 hypothetical protein J502_2884 [Acinetobacter sp. 1294596]